MIRVEFYDLARRRAGRERVDVDAATLGDALRAAARACPGFASEIEADGRPREHWRVSVNGERFVVDPTTPLHDGDALLVLSAQAGG